MKRVSLIFFLMLVSLANLVFAADWHELKAGTAEVPGEAVDVALDANAQSGAPADHTEHHHPPGGSCVHSHSCHAHAHLFSIDTDGYGIRVTTGHDWRAFQLPLPPQHFMAPDVPPPIA